MGRMLKVDEVTERLGVSRQHLWQMYFRLPHDPTAAPPRIQVSSRRYLWDEDSLEAWLKSRETAGAVRAIA